MPSFFILQHLEKHLFNHVISIHCSPRLGSKDPELNVLDLAILEPNRSPPGSFDSNCSPLPPTKPSHRSSHDVSIPISITRYWESFVQSSGVFQQRSQVWGLLTLPSIMRWGRVSPFKWHSLRSRPKCWRLAPGGQRLQDRFCPHGDQS